MFTLSLTAELLTMKMALFADMALNPTHSLTIAELRSVSVHTTPQCPHKWQGLKVIQTAQTQQDSRHSFAAYEQQGSAEEWTYSNPDPHRVRGGSWLKSEVGMGSGAAL